MDRRRKPCTLLRLTACGPIPSYKPRCTLLFRSCWGRSERQRSITGDYSGQSAPLPPLRSLCTQEKSLENVVYSQDEGTPQTKVGRRRGHHPAPLRCPMLSSRQFNFSTRASSHRTDQGTRHAHPARYATKGQVHHLLKNRSRLQKITAQGAHLLLLLVLPSRCAHRSLNGLA